MPFDISLAIRLGRFVQDAYNMNRMADPANFSLSDTAYNLINVIYGDDQWDSIDGYVPFGFIAHLPTIQIPLATHTVNLVSCVSEKKSEPALAKGLYIST